MTDTTIAPLTADERAADHEPYDALGGRKRCMADGQVWPCRTRLLATVDAAEQRATDAEAERDIAYMMLRGVEAHLTSWAKRGNEQADTLAERVRAVLAKAPAVSLRSEHAEAALAAERAARERAEADVRRYAGDIYRMTKEIEALSVVASGSRDRLKQAMDTERAARARAERWAAAWKAAATANRRTHDAIWDRLQAVLNERDALAREVGALREAGQRLYDATQVEADVTGGFICDVCDTIVATEGHQPWCAADAMRAALAGGRPDERHY